MEGTPWKDFNFDAGRLTLAAANYVGELGQRMFWH